MLSNSSPIYPLWALIFVALSLILVPRKDYKYLLLHGFLGVPIINIVLIVAMHLLKAWKYVNAFPFTILDIPVFILIAWGATIIIFLWALPENSPIWTHHLYIALYAVTGVFIDQIFHNLGLRPFAPWYKSWMWFFPVYLVFWTNYKIYILRKVYFPENKL